MVLRVFIVELSGGHRVDAVEVVIRGRGAAQA
jgi:hypothetical protein